MSQRTCAPPLSTPSDYTNGMCHLISMPSKSSN